MQNVSSIISCSGLPESICCDSINVTSPLALSTIVSGTYVLDSTLDFSSEGLPVYKRADGKLCILFAGHWKVEMCTHRDKATATGFLHVHPDIQPFCPSDVGER